MIKKIQMNNFKLFDEQEFEFNQEFNLVIGVNGSGKSSLLKGLAISLAGWAHAYIRSETNLRPIEDNEIREIENQGRFDLTKETSITTYGEFPIVNQFNGYTFGQVNWSRTRREGSNETTFTGGIRYRNRGDGSYSPKTYDLNISTVGNDILHYIESGHNFDLPLIAFYECDRLWISKNNIDVRNSATKKYSRFEPYLDCFHTGTDDKKISEWLLKLELIEMQQKVKNPIKEAIEYAAKAALDGCTGFGFDFDQSRVMVKFEDDRLTPFEHLSDGQRTIVGLFCDIARRAAILNPHLGGDASREVKGVVLIDELDLHLHPKWQRNIIGNLRKVFPNIQFICTTHSPFLIQSLRSGDELIMLGGDPLANYSNKGIEDILKVMGVVRPDVSAEYEEMKDIAKTYLQELQELDFSAAGVQEEFKRRLSHDTAPYAENPAYQAFIELKYASKTGDEL